MGFFDAFYFMSYTATTIGFGEIPHAFTYGQRMWVVVTIYLTVIGWAYALGSLLTADPGQGVPPGAAAAAASAARVARLGEPFLLIAGYGRTGELLARSFDGLGRQLVVIDASEPQIEALDMDTYQVDIPALAGDARNPHLLSAAGLDHPLCEGVLAMTDDDEVNLAITMAAALLRPDLPVVARTVSTVIADRMMRLRHSDRGQPLRPLRQPSADRAARPCLVPVAGVARSRTRGTATRARPAPGGRQVGGVRVRALRSRSHLRSSRRGSRGHRHRPERDQGRATNRRLPTRASPSSSATRPSRESLLGPPSRTPSRSSPELTTTPLTCRCSPPPAGSTPSCSSPPGRMLASTPRCFVPCRSMRC